MSLTVIPLKMIHQLPQILMKNFTYLVFDPLRREALIIDPTWEMEKIEQALADNQLRLKSILVTHGHQDHVNLVKPLVEKYGCEVWMSAADVAHFCFECPNLNTIVDETPFQAAGLSVTPLLTPGHTMGCVCYLIDGNLFTGDTLFIEGCGMCFGKGSDPKLLYKSLQRLKNTLGDDTKIFPAHSYGMLPGKDFSFVRQNNVYLIFDEEAPFIAYRMRKGQTRLFDFQ
jgi:glyoxylase-like metal-dependent hydrolase (beta-lactamase superfamily II)